MRNCLLPFLALLSGCVFFSEDPDSVKIETSTFCLTVRSDATVESLVLKANGEEMLENGERTPLFSVTQDRPFNNEIKLTFPNKQTTYRANRVCRTGDRLIVGFEIAPYEAVVRVLEKDGYALFELEDFRVGPEAYGNLKMTTPPVKDFRLLQLPVKNRAHYGDWLNVSWDDAGSVAVVGADPLVWIDEERRNGFRLLTADACRGMKLRGARAAIVAAETPGFLDAMDVFEKDLGLPRGVASRRSPEINRSIYWSSEVTPTTVDEHIRLAKQGGFKLMLLYYPCIVEGAKGHAGYRGIGEYKLRKEYVKGYDSLHEMLAKIKANGLTPGLHILQTFIGFNSSYVTPVADRRLNLTRHFTLAKPLADQGGDLFVDENPVDCPTNVHSRILRFGGELIAYEGFTTERPYRFCGVRRGVEATRIVSHAAGEIGGVLDVCEFGGTSCYIDQNSDLQDEIAAKIARIWRCGFEFLYCDGSEGVNVPQGIHVPNAQYRVWQKLDPKPLFTEGAAKGHFGWHHLSGANAFDVFPPEKFKAMIVRWPQYEAPIMRQNFSRLNFGWWGIWEPGRRLPDGTRTVGTQPDMWEFGTSRAAAWDCPATVQFYLTSIEKHPRRADLLEVMRRWEDVRARNWLTPEMKEELKSTTQEHHLYLAADGTYELHPIAMLPTPAKAPQLRGFIFTRAGRRVIACWHTSGAAQARIDLGRGAETFEAEGLRYFETDLPEEGAVAAFAAAEFVL